MPHFLLQLSDSSVSVQQSEKSNVCTVHLGKRGCGRHLSCHNRRPASAATTTAHRETTNRLVAWKRLARQGIRSEKVFSGRVYFRVHGLRLQLTPVLPKVSLGEPKISLQIPPALPKLSYSLHLFPAAAHRTSAVAHASTLGETERNERETQTEPWIEWCVLDMGIALLPSSHGSIFCGGGLKLARTNCPSSQREHPGG